MSLPLNLWKPARSARVNDARKKKTQHSSTSDASFKADSEIWPARKTVQTPQPVSPPFLKAAQLFFSSQHLTGCNTQTPPAHVARLFGEESGTVLESAQPHKKAESVKSYQMLGKSIKQDPTRFGETERRGQIQEIKSAESTDGPSGSLTSRERERERASGAAPLHFASPRRARYPDCEAPRADGGASSDFNVSLFAAAGEGGGEIKSGASKQRVGRAAFLSAGLSLEANGRFGS